MLQVAQSQLDEMSRLREQSFAADVARELRTAFAAQVARLRLEQNVERLVGLGIDRARSYGIRDEADIRTYIQCMVLLAPNFDRAESFGWAADILRDAALTGRQKIGRISEHLLFDLGQAR